MIMTYRNNTCLAVVPRSSTFQVQPLIHEEGLSLKLIVDGMENERVDVIDEMDAPDLRDAQMLKYLAARILEQLAREIHAGATVIRLDEIIEVCLPRQEEEV